MPTVAKGPAHRLSAKAIDDLPEQVVSHAVNPDSIRHSRSLGDPLGLSLVGLHLVRLKSGRYSSEFHFHHATDEFVYILEGRGKARIGDNEVDIGAGDCLGFPAHGPGHVLSNPFDADLLYLCGGNRATNDVCDYPQANQRLYQSGPERHYEPLLEDDDS
jgi:uncharacterized cupin superfamily protein